MNRKLLYAFLITTVLFSAKQGFTQVNTYLQNNPVWHVGTSCSFSGPSCIQNEDYNYYTNGDTVFHTLTYKKIYKKGKGSYSWMASPPIPPGCSGNYYYLGANASYFIRSAGKSMFLRQPSDTSEYLLYDFNLAIGDTLPNSYNYNNAGGKKIQVTAIDSFHTPYGYRKRFAINGTGSGAQYLIEGIGNSHGLV